MDTAFNYLLSMNITLGVIVFAMSLFAVLRFRVFHLPFIFSGASAVLLLTFYLWTASNYPTIAPPIVSRTILAIIQILQVGVVSSLMISARYFHSVKLVRDEHEVIILVPPVEEKLEDILTAIFADRVTINDNH